MQELFNKISEMAHDVYGALGGGHSERVYEEAMSVELRSRDIEYEVERTTEIFYKGEKIGKHHLDFIVDSDVVVELIATDKIYPSNTAQMRSYLKTLGLKRGMVINFPYPDKASPDIEIVEL